MKGIIFFVSGPITHANGITLTKNWDGTWPASKWFRECGW